ncbi:hypothetical protein AEGHOMDF_4006 [Methylobacterium soli]|nr:hypothetical protein AEGHOMDF_4006 [Methylobacterium soli]
MGGSEQVSDADRWAATEEWDASGRSGGSFLVAEL